MFAGGVGGVLALLIAASAITGHRGGQIPVVSADPGPIRVRPENPGGMHVDAAENDVFSGGSDTTNTRLAPAAEVPNTKALEAEEAPPAPAVMAEAAPSPAASAPVEPPVPAAQAVAPAAPVAPHRVTNSVPPARPSAVARTESAAARPGTAVATATPALARPALTVPPSADRSSPDKTQADRQAEKRLTPGHTVAVQLAAMTSEDAAKAEWLRLSKRLPDLFSSHTPALSRVEHDGHTFWRLRTIGFSDISQARTFCDHVRAKGGNCSIADF
ncbi:MAG TPA: SPOR domain-containing protein [Rhodopila sp.]|nr:SPOR domain-containing protein [Rhodopila sp.]